MIFPLVGTYLQAGTGLFAEIGRCLWLLFFQLLEKAQNMDGVAGDRIFAPKHFPLSKDICLRTKAINLGI